MESKRIQENPMEPYGIIKNASESLRESCGILLNTTESQGIQGNPMESYGILANPYGNLVGIIWSLRES